MQHQFLPTHLTSISIRHMLTVLTGKAKLHPTFLNSIPHRSSSFRSAHQLDLRFFLEQVRATGISGIDPATIAASIRLCIHGNRLVLGTQIHALSVLSGLTCHSIVSNSLMNLYCKKGKFAEALKIFHNLGYRDVVSWNTILSGFPCSEGALEFAVFMARAGVHFDAVTFTTTLAFSSDLQDVHFSMQLHSHLVKVGLESDIFVGNALISTYVKSGLFEEAECMFDRMVERDLVSWNALISGYAQQEGFWTQAMNFFVIMTREGLRLDHVSFSSALATCCHERNLEFGQQIHCLAVKRQLDSCISVLNVLMSMYSRCGLADSAKRVFENAEERNVVSWTTIISIDVENALMHFKAMLLDDVEPNNVTFVALITALPEDNKHEGEMVHGFCYIAGLMADLNVSNCFITRYAKQESMQESRKIFDEIVCKVTVSWNALISGYAQNKLCEEALVTFSSMITQSQPNEFTFGSVISAISLVETCGLIYGQRCHCRALKLGLDTSEYVIGALVDMYSKQGSLEESKRIFDQTNKKTLISWTSMISAYSKHGNYDMVIDLFDGMAQSGICPDQLTFLAVLTACGHRGMVDRGCQIFDSMVFNFQIEPSAQHYSAMVDMMGRAGRLEEAEKLIRSIPTKPSLSAFQSLLGACRMHGNIEMAIRVADILMEIGPEESGTYILLSNIYAEMGDWDKVAKLRKGMRERGIRKEVGFSWVDTGGTNSMHMHGFSSYDVTHPYAEDIYWMARFLGHEMRDVKDDKFFGG